MLVFLTLPQKTWYSFIPNYIASVNYAKHVITPIGHAHCQELIVLRTQILSPYFTIFRMGPMLLFFFFFPKTINLKCLICLKNFFIFSNVKLVYQNFLSIIYCIKTYIKHERPILVDLYFRSHASPTAFLEAAK